MKLIPTLALLGALTTVSGVAAAANPTGPYIGAGIGQFNLKLDNLSDVDEAVDTISDSHDNSWKILAGYRLAPYFAVEAAYINLGKPGDTFSSDESTGNYKASIDGFAPAVLGILPIGPIEVFGKVGWYFYDVNVTANFDGGPDVDGSHSGDDLMWGVGASIVVIEHLELRAEYEQFKINDAKDSNAFWLTAAWRF
jgi:opacity protein-like surface antigen